MKKSLLLGAVALGASLSSSAFEVGEYVYASQGRYKVVGENICTNGTCASSFDGWSAMSANAENTVSNLFTYDVDKQAFYSKTNVMTEGMYYKFNVENPSGIYVVSFKIRKETAAFPYSTNVTVTTADGVNTYGITGDTSKAYNFVNLFGNTGGGVTSNDGFVSAGNAIQFTADWQTVSFAITGDGTPRDWYLAFAGMDPTVEISDVQIQEAEQYANLKERDAALAYAKAIVSAKDWDETDAYTALVENIDAVEGITEESTQEELNDAIDGLNSALTADDGSGFLDVDMDNFIATCSQGTDWSQRKNSGNRIQKQSSVGDWKFYDSNDASFARGFNQDGADLLGVKDATWWELGHFMYGNAVAAASMKMTKTLSAGVYVYSMDCSGATRYDSKVASGWTYNSGFNILDNELSIVDADGNVVASNIANAPTTAYNRNYVVANISKDGDYTFISKTYPREDSYIGTLGTLGFGYFYKNPRIFCKLSGQYDAAQLQYIADVKAQIDAVAANLKDAKALLENTEYPWLKAEMTDTVAKYEKYLAVYLALDDDAIFKGFEDPAVRYKKENINSEIKVENSGYANYIDGENPETGAAIPTYNAIDSIMVNVVKPIKRFSETYTKANTVFPELTKAIEAAKKTQAVPVYSTSTGAAALADAIAAAQKTYDDLYKTGSYKLVLAEGEENVDYNSMVEAKSTLEASVEEFKASVPESSYSTVVDIDFDTPATLNEETQHYVIAGNRGSMDISNYTVETSGNLSFTQGFDKNEEKLNAGVLRVGNGDGIVEVDPAEYEGKIVRITFDYYFGSLTKRNNGFQLKDAEGNTVASLYFCSYDNSQTTPENTFGFDLSKFTRVGSGAASNDAIYDEANNKNSFELILDYVHNTMYATGTSKNGAQTTEEIPLNSQFTQFIVKSNYNIEARRSWFDNLKIQTVAVSTGVNGVNEVENATDDNAIYNVAGQKVSAPVKGQIYIKKGAAFVK